MKCIWWEHWKNFLSKTEMYPACKHLFPEALAPSVKANAPSIPQVQSICHQPSFIFNTPPSLQVALAQDGSLSLPNLPSGSTGDNGLKFQEIAMQVFSQAVLLQRALQLLTEVNEGTLGAVTPMMMRTLGLWESGEEDEVDGGPASN